MSIVQPRENELVREQQESRHALHERSDTARSSANWRDMARDRLGTALFVVGATGMVIGAATGSRQGDRLRPPLVRNGNTGILDVLLPVITRELTGLFAQRVSKVLADRERGTPQRRK